jgi:hypothetical protein
MKKSILAGLIAASIGSLLAWADGISIPFVFPASTCTNQFIRSIAASTGVGTCATVNFASDGTGVVPAANGGAGATNGALKANGSGAVSQAASTDLSDTTAATTWTPTDASTGGLTFTSVSGNFSKANKTCAGTLRLTYPITADGAHTAALNLPCTLANNQNMAVGSCWSTAPGVNGVLIMLAFANTSVTTFVNTAGGAASPLNSALSTFIVSCQFSFITT